MEPMSASTRAARRGPVEGEHVMGWDRERSARPGVPMRVSPSRPEGAPAAAPAEQAGIDRRTHRAGLHRGTPVFGTAQPLRGLSGAIRRAAYRIPEHHARHWMLLMTADRVDVLEGRLGRVAAAPAAVARVERFAAPLRSNPVPFLVGAAAGVVAVFAWRGRKPVAG